MIIKTLVENTTVSSKYEKKHGLCLYIETNKHKILFDLGQNRLFLENAKKMGVVIADIDTVIISHGHIDHGGALKYFLENNKIAKIYIRENAFDKHTTKMLGMYFDIGIDNSLKFNPQVLLTTEQTIIDDELLLFSNVTGKELYSKSNDALYMLDNDEKVYDDFSHEQHLIISDGIKKVLFAGCAHTGIVNIKKEAEKIVNGNIKYVIGGFHLFNPVSKKKENKQLVNEVGKRLNDEKTKYYTCHCTGTTAYSILKKILNENISYLSTGSQIEL